MALTSKRQNVLILGATGSIGKQSLDVMAAHPERFRVFGLTAHTNIELLYQQCIKFEPNYAVMSTSAAADELKTRLKNKGLNTIVLNGEQALGELAADSEVDTVISAIVGGAGLPPTFKAASAGKRILLANKEALVMAGALLIEEVSRTHAELLPVDSEHNAIFQCMPSGYRAGEPCDTVSKLILTASGGPFRCTPLETLSQVTPEAACQHPNWDMGAKISVDSATMMNKGLEVIEAYWLFYHPISAIEVLIHPQSLIHSFVEYIDGSMLAQLATPDMHIPIASALGWPQRLSQTVPKLDLLQVGSLEFESPCPKRYPCLQFAYEAIKMGGSAPAVLNAANEVAVDAFLNLQIQFTQIAEIIEKSLNDVQCHSINQLEDVVVADQKARCYANEIVKRTRPVTLI